MADTWKKEKGIRIMERQISIHELLNSYNEKRLVEMFGVSASSFVRPFSQLVYRDQSMDLRGEYPLSYYID